MTRPDRTRKAKYQRLADGETSNGIRNQAVHLPVAATQHVTRSHRSAADLRARQKGMGIRFDRKLAAGLAAPVGVVGAKRVALSVQGPAIGGAVDFVRGHYDDRLGAKAADAVEQVHGSHQIDGEGLVWLLV